MGKVLYDLVVGNIGTVISDSKDLEYIKKQFEEYVDISKNDSRHRAFGENVTIFEHGENYSNIYLEYYGHLIEVN